jgi:hypothetical protein
MAGGSCRTLATAIAACADQLRFLTGRHGVGCRTAHSLAAEAEHLKDLLCSVMKAIIWGQKEIHFGNHFCVVEAWTFGPKSDQYIKAFEYRTKKKYGGGDAEPICVLAGERPEILRRLEAK